MKKVLEVVTYALLDSLKYNEFKKVSDVVTENSLPKLSGFLQRNIMQDPDGMICDIATWESMEDAKNALEKIMKDQKFLQMMPYIDESTIKMQHFEL